MTIRPADLGTQLETIGSFVKKLPPNVKTAIAYMQNGQAIFAAPLSADYTQVLHALHLPAGSAGSSASPYFCLSNLAKHWPSQDQAARREVIMVSDGVDPYAMRYDPDNPYLQAAISDSVRARLVVIHFTGKAGDQAAMDIMKTWLDRVISAT